MKKITLTLLAALSSAGMVFGQANITVEAPPRDMPSPYIQDVVPTGEVSNAASTTIFLVTQSELSSITGTAITGLGVQLLMGTGGPAVSYQYSVYLSNTADATYSAGTSFTAATNSLVPVYAGNYNLPASSSTSTLSFTFPQTFTYTGQGLYVAMKWVSTGPFVTANANGTNLSFGVANSFTPAIMSAGEIATSAAALTDVMQAYGYRPALLFKAVNTATNEIGINEISAPGLVAKSLNNPQHVMAYIKNSGISAHSNVTASLTVTGANTFNDVQTISSSISAGGVVTVTFAAFNPTVMGTNTITVRTSADQNNNNNMATWIQSVTCNMAGNNPPLAITAFTNGIGFPNSGIFSTPLNIGTNGATLTAVRISIANDVTDNSGKKVCGVLMDDSGTILGTSDTVLVVNNSFQTFLLNPSQPLNPNSTYYIGLEQFTGPMFPMGFYPANISAPMFFASPPNGGGFNPNNNFGYFGIEPILGPDVTITASSNSLICLGETISLQTDGSAVSYTWSAVPNTSVNAITTPNASAIDVVPTKSETTLSFTVKGIDAAGCTNSQTFAAKVSACTGIATNTLKDAKINLYPNPANGKVTIAGLEGNNVIRVYNMLGMEVLNKSTNEESTLIDLASQPEGNYLVKIVDSNNQSRTLKFINQR